MRRTSLGLAFLSALLVLATGCVTTVNTVYGLPPRTMLVNVDKNAMVPMSDGTRLATDVYHPVGAGPGPAIMVRTPYGKSGRSIDQVYPPVVAKLFAGHGYRVVIQDCRGRYNSEGDFYPFLAERDDGRDTLAWIRDQPWSDGKVGTWGGSYFGLTQWVVSDLDPGPDAMVPIVTANDINVVIYEGGALNYVNMLGWAVGNRTKVATPPTIEEMIRGLWTLPVIMADDEIAGQTVPFFDDAASGRFRDISRELGRAGRLSRVKAPALCIAGWYDLFGKYQIEDIMKLRKRGLEPARSMSGIIVGPWGHGVFANPPVKFKDGSIARLPQFKKVLAWYDQLLKGEDSGVDSWPAYTTYIMGAGQWREFDQWPPAGVAMTSFYLQSGGMANSAAGGGFISRDLPGAEPADLFIYDPNDPVPTTGGPLLGADLGPKDQAEVEKRDDVLVYTSEALAHPLTVTGPIKVVLYAATDGPDTDFTAKLCDVDPAGLSINIADGITRARYREGDMDSPCPVRPGQVYRYEIDLWHTAHQFRAGHRIRVQISSSNFPRFDRNLNTGEDLARSSRVRVAAQTIYHDQQRPSALVLPVLGE